ncbi:MAG: enoyl-CoA hydratase/isomerase family protein [Desulfurococcales archaeon]|nr:enoyl-CoA hydratase/isomerase family protein [Desulfurococcales archaeon]
MPIRVERRGPASWIIIDRVDKGNSLDLQHALQLADTVRAECSHSDTSVIVLRGAGDRFFSTGVDLEAVASIRGPEDSWMLMGEGLGGVCRALSECSKPVIAAVNGHAVGIGFEMLYASDIAIAVKGAKLGSPAAKWGMVPPATTTIGPWIIGYKAAAYIALTGRLLSSEEALRLGIINMVVDSPEDLDRVVEEIVEDITRNDQWAVRTAKELLREARLHMSLQRGLAMLVYSASRNEARRRARGFLEGKASK